MLISQDEIMIYRSEGSLTDWSGFSLLRKGGVCVCLCVRACVTIANASFKDLSC